MRSSWRSEAPKASCALCLAPKERHGYRSPDLPHTKPKLMFSHFPLAAHTPLPPASMNQSSSRAKRDRSEPASNALTPAGLGFVWSGHVTQADSRAQLPREWWLTTDEETLSYLKVLSRGLQRGDDECQAPHCWECCLSPSRD